MPILPLFTSAYSFRSILTVDKPDDVVEGGPDSIIKICKDNGLKEMYLVEDNMVGFLEAKKNAKGLHLIFGLRLTFCADITQKTPDSKSTECKYVIFARNPSGYFRLIQIFSKANVEGFNDYARMDFKTLQTYWSDDDLILAIPFYDSFIHKNISEMANCIPDFSFTKPIFFIERNGLYFDNLIKDSIQDFDQEGKYEKIPAQTIYYKDKKDFFAWQAYKCIKNESTLRKPNLENCMSNEFCFESWKEKNA